MRYPFLIAILTVFITFSLDAQNSVEGTVTYENGTAAKNTVVELHYNSSSTLIKKWSVDESGYVIMDGIADGDYHLVVTSKNYEPIIIENFRFPQDNDTVFGLIMKELKLQNLITSKNKTSNLNPICVHF